MGKWLKPVLLEVQTRSGEPTNYSAEVIPGHSISIFLKGELRNTFMIGDKAEYDYRNWSMNGPITSISLTTVCVSKGEGQRAFMPLVNFCVQNLNFEEEQATAFAAEEMKYT